MSADPCRGAESMMQPYIDRVLTEVEAARIDAHLRDCSDCSDRLRRRCSDQA
jgi:predicted anti-sigma-YlaC factor YlaD